MIEVVRNLIFEFMQAANDFVHEFARRFAISHPGVEVLVSDSSVHGEGEHKIMDWLRSGDDSLNHVIVGNDSDLYLLLAVSNKASFNLASGQFKSGGGTPSPLVNYTNNKVSQSTDRPGPPSQNFAHFQRGCGFVQNHLPYYRKVHRLYSKLQFVVLIIVSI